MASNNGPGGFGRGSGGMGRPRGGIGFPGGGGIGFPGGGGYPGGSGRYPGGNYPGGGYPGGGSPSGTGYPGGNGGPDSGRGQRGFHGTVRWESALPVQEALRIGAEGEKPSPDFEKYYVLTLLGELPMIGEGRLGDDSSEDKAQKERRQEMFKQYTKLDRGGKRVQLVKIEEGSRIAGVGPGTHFYFSRLDDISLDDKTAAFSTKLGPLEISTKFTLKDMLYHGKLTL